MTPSSQGASRERKPAPPKGNGPTHTKVFLLTVNVAEFTAPLLDYLGHAPLWILASGTDPLSDHALKLPHPTPFCPMDANGERVSEDEKGFALVVLVFEVVNVHSVIFRICFLAWA